MYGHPIHEVVHADCPMCGKKEGSHMSASRWSHDFCCCSDKCGEELGLLIEKNISSKEYENIYKEYEKLEKQLSKVIDKLDSMVKTNFKSNVIEFRMGERTVRSPKKYSRLPKFKSVKYEGK